MISSPGNRSPGFAIRGGRNLTRIVPGQVAVSIVLVASGVVIPRWMGVGDFGVYSAVIAVVATLQAVSSAGFNQVETRFLAPLWQWGDSDQAAALASALVSVRVWLAAAAAVIALVWLRLMPGLDLGRWVILAAGILCGARCLFAAVRGVQLPLGRPGTSVALDVGRVAVNLVFSVLGYEFGGISGAFGSLAVAYIVMLGVGISKLPRTVLISTKPTWITVLRPHVVFAISAYAGTVSGVVHGQVSILLLAGWSDRREAAYLAVALQAYVLIRAAMFASRRALMPLLAEMDHVGDTNRIRRWGETMARYFVAGCMLVVMTWWLVGESVVDVLLSSRFAAVDQVLLVLMVSLIPFSIGFTCNGLLLIQGRPGYASANLIATSGVTLLGLAIVVSGQVHQASLRIAWVYVISSGVFAVLALLVLWGRTGLWLPLRRAVALAWPLAVVIPFRTWDPALHLAFWTWAFAVAVYLGSCVVLRLVPWPEVRSLVTLGVMSLRTR